MRKKQNQSVYSAFFAIAAAILPFQVLHAQDETPADTLVEAAPVSPEQQAEIDTWPPEQRVAYDQWPDVTKAYYWGLSESRQMLFWRLPDEDKVALSAMTGEDQEAAWRSLEARAANPAPDESPPSEM